MFDKNKAIDIAKKIGILEDNTSIEGNILPNEFINNKNLSLNITHYDTYSSLVEALYNNMILNKITLL